MIDKCIHTKITSNDMLLCRNMRNICFCIRESTNILYFRNYRYLKVFIKLNTLLLWFSFWFYSRFFYVCIREKVLLWILSISISIRRFFNIRLDATRNIIDMNVPDCVVPVCILNKYSVSQQRISPSSTKWWSQMLIYQKFYFSYESIFDIMSMMI